MTKILAIVGGGPRGLSALESIYRHLALKGIPKSLLTLFFEARELPGAGHVYDPGQPDTNWLNVSERGLTLPKRAEIKCGDFSIPSFPSYHQWAGYDSEKEEGSVPDKFPLRSTLGNYLNERYSSMATVLESKGLLQFIKGEVVETDWNEGQFTMVLKNGALYHSDELVLTIGHQPTKFSDQLQNWVEYAATNDSVDLVTEPYPVGNILRSRVLDSKSVVALRGFGLAMIDVMRALTMGRGGQFEEIEETTQKMRYLKSGREPNKIVPFSLDGLPMSPKPLHSEIDLWFKPSEEVKENLKTSIGRSAQEGSAKDIRFLVDAMAPIIARVFDELGAKAYPHTFSRSALQEIISSYLADESFRHELIVPTSDAAKSVLEAYVGMATGTEPISLDYCIGQVWRHCQPILYDALSFSNLEEETIADIVDLDERIKRYSYGPPVASLQQLLALIKADLVNLTFVNDPEIETTDKGWKLSKEKKSIRVDLMVNSVLDPPKLLEINSPIVRHLLEKSLVKPIHGELGIETYVNGCVTLEKEGDEIPLAVLGRISKGTLIGVDAILECFGNRSELWAEGVVGRLKDSLCRRP